MPRGRKPRQANLPGTDGQITELETSALEYVEHREERQEALREEVRLKDDLIALMKKHNKTVYRRDGFELRLVVEKEKIKVKVAKGKTAAGEQVAVEQLEI